MGKIKISTIGYCVSALFALLSLISLFSPVLILATNTREVTGLEVTFGAKKWGLGFSFMNLMTYVFVLLGLAATALIVLRHFGVELDLPVLNNTKLLAIVAIVCFVLAAAFFNSTAYFLVPDIPKGAPARYRESVERSLTLGSGSVLSRKLGIYPYYNGGYGIFVIIAAIGTAVSTALDR